MLNGEGYRASLDDGRSVYIRGERIENMARYAPVAATIDRIARTYDRGYDPAPGATNPLLAAPRSAEEFRERLAQLHGEDLMLHVTYQSLMALLTAAGRIEQDFPEGAARVRAYVEDCRRRDVRMVQCITDSKGDRSRSAGAQTDPDQYLHVVERRDDGVVIRGAKLHISGAAIAHELMVMPTKRMKPGEEEYAVACGVAVNTPGVKIVSTMPDQPGDADPREFPLSWDRVLPEALIVFDDVFVPNERIFLDGHVASSAAFAHSLGLWERLSATGGQVRRAEQAVGLAQLIAEANGTERIPHIRDKVNDLVLHATLLRATFDAALVKSREDSDGILIPDELNTNAAKVLAGEGWAAVVARLVDIAGGSTMTAPSPLDFDHPDVAEHLDKYMSGVDGISGIYRARLFHLIKNMTADGFGGWLNVTTIHAGGGLYAQRLVMRKHFDMDSAKATALALLGGVNPVQAERAGAPAGGIAR
ncbi:4-hydroxyphenylacetate 3-hydroxylase N-terminal domain-containing protein [Microbacterium fluvii]|uniref:4-hydroxyphenylacetate 3-hydroxylase N-terminal domain-containing protein n=1 Tax=Microbacterium fluvii TaxID=415215 RepID=A0ABW2H8V8_9MICO|nr:4-hydroxyphenylacetate 3-hydroxylase N-terminal domain-containing protein [Microbacterium fluvii]MCU4671161.1 hypothetical protein [Microbacterium fluvii]